ncbi:ALP1-like protein isoform X1 [Tanacetum coccineum]
MDPNNHDFYDTYDHYDVYFQSDYDRFTRDYEHFVALCEQEAGGSSSAPKRRKTYIPRERESAEQRLLKDYFGNDEFKPKYPEENFRRMCRMSSTLFNKIVNNILSYDVEPILEYFTYFKSRYDVTGRLSIGPILKCTSAIHQLAYDTAPDAFDEYLQIAEPDDIYPAWSTFVKMFPVARDEKSLKFKRVQEAARKDIERAFGVLQGRWGFIRQPARPYQINTLKRIMYCCIMLHNMILDDKGFEVNMRDLFVNPANIQRDWVERCDLHIRKSKELRDRKTHIDLRQDLVEHLSNNH